MSSNSKIEWTDATWNPVRGCTKISPGCAHCYAETFAERFRGVPGHPYEQGFDLRLVPEKLTEPLTWSRQQMVFVNGNVWNELQLPVGKYDLNRGLLHLRFAGGVMVYLEAPAQFEPLSGQRLLLRSGRLSANVPPEGIGFVVETPEAEVTDFGTEFSVDVSVGASEVHVFEGLVRVQPRSRQNVEAAEAVDLRASQAVKIEWGASRWDSMKMASFRQRSKTPTVNCNPSPPRHSSLFAHGAISR